ncbi:MAG: aminoacyl-tRNA hydrolase [Candidatus Woesearchaeota archaeon]
MVEVFCDKIMKECSYANSSTVIDCERCMVPVTGAENYVVPNNKADELVMYFIVNKELDMSPGKIAGQVAHTLANYFNFLWIESGYDSQKYNRELYLKWYNDNQKKIILKAKESKLETLEKDFWGIRDLGLTEIKKNSLTCICLGIGTRKEFEPIVKRLRLL